MSTFTIRDSQPPLTVNLTPEISKEQLLSFPAFKIWLSTLQTSLSQQSSNTHAFHASPYALRRIDVQAVDIFGHGRIGFVKLKAEVSNENGEMLPGSVFLRGGSVGMLVRSTAQSLMRFNLSKQLQKG
jgi:ADP-sugar diphosphatase